MVLLEQESSTLNHERGKNMKKFVTVLLASLMTLSMVACNKTTPSGEGESEIKYKDSYTYVFSADLTQMDYVVTARAADHQFNVQLVDGLIENDKYGHYIGSLAESWDHNDTYDVWTFKIRKGVKWSTSTGEVYPEEVTAHDWVTGAQHAIEFASGTLSMYRNYVKGVDEYYKGTITDMADVGIKALDDYTLEFTLTQPTPFFHTVLAYAIAYPVNKTFLESRGTGCKLGAPDPENCKFGTTEPDSILYNGAFILTQNVSKSVIEMVKNENYWDKEHVYLNSAKWIYNDGSDAYAGINGFEQGTYDYAIINANWADFSSYVEKYKDYYHTTLPSSSTFNLNFNFNRVSYEYTNHTTEQEKKDTQFAILNVNFRRALRAAYDKVAYLSTRYPEEVAIGMQRNMNNFPGIVSNSEGKTFGQLVTEAYQKRTGTNIDLSDGQNPFLSKEQALAYIEEAKKEGVKFPVVLDVLVIGNGAAFYRDQAESLSKSVSDNTDGQILIKPIYEDTETVQRICYLNNDPSLMDYDINTFSGWGPDYVDPMTFSDLYSTTIGFYTEITGLAIDDSQDNYNLPDSFIASSDAAKEAIGLNEYEKLIMEANSIIDPDPRYEKFAEAEALFVDQVIALCNNSGAQNYVIFNYEPFTAPYSFAGLGGSKLKGLKIRTTMSTREEYYKAYEDFKANQGI